MIGPSRITARLFDSNQRMQPGIAVGLSFMLKNGITTGRSKTTGGHPTRSKGCDNDRGFAYANKKDYDRAIKDYDEAIRLDPKFVLAYNNRGNAYSEKNEFDRAIKEFDEAIRLDPKHIYAYNNRGLV